MTTGSGGRKRRKARPAAARAKKKQKWLNDIVDRPIAGSTSAPPPDDDPSSLRRSSRPRRAPVLLDSSPVRSTKLKNPNPNPNSADSTPIQRKEKGKEKEQQKASPLTPSSKDSEAGSENWRSRLRSRACKGREEEEEDELWKPMRRRGRKKPIKDDGYDFMEPKKVAVAAVAVAVQVSTPAADNEEKMEAVPPETEIELDMLAQEPKEPEPTPVLPPFDESDDIELDSLPNEAEADGQGEELPAAEEARETHKEGGMEELDHAGPAEGGRASRKNKAESPVLDDKVAKPRLKEGRRCGLCGGGTDGRPPKRLAEDITDSDKEAYEGAWASEESNYNMWDGFGDEPGWLGKLLGPMRDRFGIARVWVHQHCAVWSPEVYFAGLGCMKNIRAALVRGRQLKCSRCGRPGATIGCRVDRCPKTFHLPCSRAEGCIFDHRKFLIACNHHRRLFQPRGNEYHRHMMKMKAKKLKLDMRKLSNDASRKDLEAEEKWLENCGEDEEFLKREGKRLHRDILRIAPVYIGGSSESEKLYNGWESVAGLEDVIQCMKEVVLLPLLYPEFFSSLGITPPRGILLHGYPGTGKTLVVRALIGACSRGDKRIAYFARKGADCLGKYVGDAERQLRLLFQVAERCQPSIIFFDEIDGLAPCRSRHQDQTHCSVVSTLLSLLDGLKSRGSVIVIGASNRPDAVDPALRRPGRFDREIHFPLPSEKDRSAILSLHTQSWPRPLSGSLLSWIANQTDGYAGADLQSLCTQAAMSALKRNCPLQEYLSSAEKSSGRSTLPSLPSFVVEERDWLAALAFASPPCSRRDAGISANGVLSSPLQKHLIPCLLQPLLQLLISIYIDERIVLPPSLFKASKSIESVITSALKEKRVPIVSWWSHLNNLIQEPYIANEIERYLSIHGLLVGSSGSGQVGASDDDNNDPDKSNSHKSIPSSTFSSKIQQNTHIKLGNSLGFRALISGSPRSGQQHLAGCLLHGFRGHVEIQKVTLATISHQGQGDPICGLSQILTKCLSLGSCIIYMPRIELWAINKSLGQEADESTVIPDSYPSSPILEVKDVRISASEAWNSFAEQVDSACTSSSITFLATCEVENNELPLGLRQFFTSYVSDHTGAPTEHSIPRFVAHIDGNLNPDLVLKSSAEKLSQDLAQHYVQLVHRRIHMRDSQDEATHIEVFSKTQQKNMGNEQTSAAFDAPVGFKQIVSNNEASCRDKLAPQVSNQGRSNSPRRSLKEVDIQLLNHQDSFSRIIPNKVTRGSSMSAIATFGYQILCCPQFAELCWLTSKLKEGPFADINGPWKQWPFNSCVMRHSSSPSTGVNSGNLKDKEHSGIVNGLVAVGLLASRGVYTSVKEVSLEVRKVLELLVGRIRAKVSVRSDRSYYPQLLSQVAYLEDMVNSWAYSLRSLPTDNPTRESNITPSIIGRSYADKNSVCAKVVDTNSCMPSVPNLRGNEAREVSHAETQKIVASNEEGADISIGHTDITTYNTSMLSEPNYQDPQLVALPSSLHQIFSSAEATGDIPLISESITASKINEFGLPKSSPKANEHNRGGTVTASNPCSEEAGRCCNGFQDNLGIISEKPCSLTDLVTEKNTVSSISEISCMYECCAECLHAIYVLTHRVLSDCWKRNGCCSTIDDIHDTVAACSSNIIVAVSKCFFSQRNSTSAEYFGGEHHQRAQIENCVCQETADSHLQKSSSPGETSRNATFIPTECTCHSGGKGVGSSVNSRRDSLPQPKLKFFFRDGVLKQSIPPKDAELHCKFEKLCICSLLKMIMIKQQNPLD